MNPSTPQRKNKYQHFDAAIYCRVYEVNQMSDLSWLRERFDIMSRWVKVSKVYLETHRDMRIASEDTLNRAREFLESRGVKVSGGITVTVNEMNRFQTYCFTNPEHRQKLIEIVQYTARLFDEIILDDFFFTNCKCPACIAAKGERTWTEFRLELMAEAARSLVMEPARAANPNVKVTIKYPNWYEHFQGLGFNLEDEPAIFDFLYTGTETRDPAIGNQHLQPYHGYSIFRYFEHLKPGCNRGGWVDTGGMRTLDRYAEQLWITLFAKAPEVTLFDFRQLQRPIQEEFRAPWQGENTSFDFDSVTARARQKDGSLSPDATVALAAGAAFEQVDAFYGDLGNPLGVPCYKPFHSTGEDFLPSYLGMLGIPIDLVAQFPTDAPVVLLTEAAKFDLQIVEKIKRQLLDGKSVVITSGLLRVLQHGISDIVELEVTGGKISASEFLIGWNQIYQADQPILVPHIRYLTNDSWEEISCMSGATGTPLLHSAQYASGTLFVLTIPDNFSDLYRLPAGVLNRIRDFLTRGLPVRIEAPGQVALYLYDNDTFILDSFLPETKGVAIVADDRFQSIQDFLSGEELRGEELLDWRKQKIGKKCYPLSIKPHSFRVFKAR